MGNPFKGAPLVGRGGFGPVYKAIWADGKWVAVKVFESSIVARGGVPAFEKDVKTLLGLRHRRLLPLLAALTEPASPVMLVFPLMTWGSLREVNLNPPMSSVHLAERERLQIALDVASALQYLHRLGLVHRAVKTPK